MNLSKSGETSSEMDDLLANTTIDFVIKHTNGTDLFSAYHVQDGCFGSPLKFCVQK